MEVLLSAASGANSLCLWDLKRGILLKQYKQSPPTKKSCVTTLGDSFIMVTSDVKMTDTGKVKSTQNSKVLAWSWETEAAHSHSFVPYNLTAFVGSSCGTYSFGGTSDGQLLTWHTPSGNLIHILPDYFQGITSLGLHLSSEFLAVGCSDGTIHVISVPFLLSGMSSEFNFGTLALHSLPVSSLAYSACSSSRLFSTSLDQTFKIWHTETRSCLCSISFPTSLTCQVLSPVEDFAFLGGVDGNIYKVNLWDLPERDFGILDSKSGKLPEMCTGHTGSITSLDINIDGSLLVSGSDDESVKVWSTTAVQQVSSFSRPSGPITYVKIVLKPPSAVMGNLNTKEKIQLPILKPFANVKTKPTGNIVIKGGSNSFSERSFSHLGFDPYWHPPLPLSTSQFVADVEIQNYALHDVQEKYQNTEGALDDRHVSILQQEVTHLKRVNSQWKTLNNQLLAATLNNFNFQ